jgi:Mn-dependent DtxR family transcriptional regulator
MLLLTEEPGGVFMALHESGEMYLETIYILTQRSDSVRSIDVGEYMGYSKPSVSRAVGLLKKDGYIVIDEKGYINLTETGRQKAEQIYERHLILTSLFQNLGVDEETASEDACRIEHYLSDKTFNAIKAHMNKYKS